MTNHIRIDGESVVGRPAGHIFCAFRTQSETYLDQLAFDGDAAGGGAVGDVELGQHVRNVGGDGSGADEQSVSDLGIGESLAHQPQYFDLALSQPASARFAVKGRFPGS